MRAFNFAKVERGREEGAAETWGDGGKNKVDTQILMFSGRGKCHLS